MKSKGFLGGLKKGALREQLGVPARRKIPPGVRKKLAEGNIGTHVQYRGKSIAITPLLQERARLAQNMSKWKRRK
jgi:hypothetical protein